MRYTFGSNVAPRKIKYPAPSAWWCHKCDKEVASYHKKCPSCRSPRKD